MKWLTEVLDELSKVFIDLGKGVLLATVGAVILAKNISVVFIIMTTVFGIGWILVGLYLAKVFRSKEKKDGAN